MATLTNLRKTLTDTTPIYALVGVADLALAQVKSASDEAADRAAALRTELAPKAVSSKVSSFAKETVATVQALPSTVATRANELSDEAEKSYEDFSKRGEKVVSSLRQQKVVAQSEDALKSARKVADDTQTFALKSVLAGRKEAAQVVEGAAAKVEDAASATRVDARTEARSAAGKQGAVDRKAPARKTTAKKAPARKTTAKKSAAKKTTANSAKTTPASATSTK